MNPGSNNPGIFQAYHFRKTPMTPGNGNKPGIDKPGIVRFRQNKPGIGGKSRVLNPGRVHTGGYPMALSVFRFCFRAPLKHNLKNRKGTPHLGVPKRRNSTRTLAFLTRGLTTKKIYAQLQIFRKLQLFEKSLLETFFFH